MSNHRFTPEAAADLFEIWSYIASDSTVTGQSDFGQSSGFQITSSFTVPRSSRFKIIRILHGKRNIQRLLHNP